MTQYEDNMACIEWTNTMIFGRERAKHIDIRKHFAHEAAQIGHLRLKRISTDDQLADVFTKGLQPPGSRHNSLQSLLAFSDGSDVGPHEGGRDSQREQSESTSTLTRGVSQ